MKKDQRGFTLMELMIVIVIIGVLAAIGVPAYKNYVTEAKEAACKANMRTVATAFRMYYAENGEYLLSDDQGVIVGALAKYITNIDTIVKCPADRSIYTYKIASSGVNPDDRLVTITCDEHGTYVVAGTPSEVELPSDPGS